MQVGTVLRNRYEIVRFLGSGGFGDTYVAEDTDLPGHPQCVVKQLKPKSPDPLVLQAARVLFDREAKVLYDLGNAHDQIPRLFAHFEENGEFYLVQEFVDGYTLNQELISGQPWSEPSVLQLLKEILEVLAVVHQHGVIYRDIKPLNLMRRHHDKKIVLIDFGAVKEINALAVDSQGQTTSTIAIGTAGYMPPEQAQGHPVPASDVYAVGVLAIQALLGEIPKQDPGTGDLIWKNLVSVSPQLANTLERMTRYHFRDRYPSAGIALTALVPTILMPPPSSVHKPSGYKPSLTSPRWRLYSVIGCAAIGVAFTLSYCTINSSDKIRALESIQRVKERYKQQDESGVIKGLVRVIEFDSNYVVADDNRGVNYRDQDELQEALNNLNKTIIIDPKNVAAYNARGAIYYDLNKQEEALHDFNKAINLEPKLAAAYNNRGYVYYNQNKKKDALEDFNKAINLEPRLAVSHNGRGVIYLDRDEQKKSLEDLDKAINLNSQYAIAYHNRGSAYYRKGKYQNALEDFNKTIGFEPKLANTYNGKGNIYYDQRKFKDALDNYNKAIELDPKLAFAYSGRGNIYYDQRKFKDALDNYSKAIELDPKLAFAYNGRGNAYYTQGKAKDALDNYNKAIDLDPKLAFAYSSRGNIYYDQRKFKDALDNYNKAIELDPKLAFAYNGRGNVYYTQGKAKDALDNYNKAIDLDPKLAVFYKNRGNAYLALNNKSSAFSDYLKASLIERNKKF